MGLPSHPCSLQHISDILSKFLLDLSPLLFSLLVSHRSHTSLILLAHSHTPVIHIRLFFRRYLLLRSCYPLYNRGNCSTRWEHISRLFCHLVPGAFQSMPCDRKTCS